MNFHEKMTYAEFFEQARKLYSLLADDLSKEIFEARLCYSATESQAALDDLVRLASKTVQNTLIEYKKQAERAEKIILYGAGSIGLTMLHILSAYKEKIVFCDRAHATMKNVQGVPVVSAESLMATYQNEMVIICAIPGYDEIYAFLQKHHVPLENIYSAVIFDEDNFYFDEIVQLDEGEIFADVGAFQGETSLLFAKKMAQAGKKYKQIYIFEPDPQNLKNLKPNLEKQNLSCVHLHEIGIWNEDATLQFFDNLKVGSTIHENGTSKIKVNSLDNIFAGKPLSEYPTYIKMDIEGAELKALQGAREIITKTKPKLAVSMYHKPQDILELLAYLYSLLPDYTFYLRHYTAWKDETVLYAI